MSQTAHDISPIREAASQGRYDVAERLVREALALVMPADPAEAPLKVLLAGLIARRGIQQAQDALAVGNRDGARKILRRTYKQLDHEGINGKGTVARTFLERAAVPLDDPDLSAEQYGVIVSEVIGARQFFQLLDDLPESFQAVAVEKVSYNPEFRHGSPAPTDSLITRIFARKRKHQGASKTVEEVALPAGGTSTRKSNTQRILREESSSVAEVFIASLLRPRVIASALVVFLVVALLGFSGREVTYVSRFALLRDTTVDNSNNANAVSVLPKEQLGRLPRQTDVVSSLQTMLVAEFPDPAFSPHLRHDALTQAITATVDTGDRNSRDFGLNVTFRAPTEAVAARGAEALRDLVRNRHSAIVMQKVNLRLENRRADHKAIKAALDKLNDEIAALTGTGFASIGSFETRLELLNKLLVESKLAVERAEIDAVASETRATKVDEGFEDEPQTREMRTEEVLSSVFWALQPMYTELTSRWEELRRVELQIKNRDLGPGHELVREAETLRQNIREYEANVVKVRDELVGMKSPRVEEIRNTVYERLKVESTLGLADREAAKAGANKAQAFFESINTEIDNLKKIELLDKELRELLAREAHIAGDLYEIEDYVKTNPGDLGIIADVEKPAPVATSMMMILLAAIGLGLVAGTIAALTGGQRTLQMSLLSLLVALFHLRP